MTVVETIRNVSLSLPEGDDSYDDDILTYVNGQMLALEQMGVNVKMEVSANTTWDEWLDEPISRKSAIKRLMTLGAILELDPPNGTVSKAYENVIAEIQNRLV